MFETTGGFTSEELQLRQLLQQLPCPRFAHLSTILPKEFGQNIQGLA